MFPSSQPRYKLIDPTKSSKTITVWIFLWSSYPPIWGQPSREIYFGIRKFTSNCSKRKDSGNVTWVKILEQFFGDSTILSKENLKILGRNIISPVNCNYSEPADWSFFSGCNDCKYLAKYFKEGQCAGASRNQMNHKKLGPNSSTRNEMCNH